MKKNKMMRLASVLMVLTLLTTSVIGGTFAKYVTTAESSDTARVAKWGIKMDENGADMFSYSYDTTDGSVENEAADKDLVAPGTAGSVVYSVTGTPETDYVISFSYAAADVQEVYLGEGYYSYPTTEGYVAGMNQSVSEKYYPVEYSVTIDYVLAAGETDKKGTIANVNAGESAIFAYGTAVPFATIGDALTALQNTTISFDENVKCDVTVTIAWEWDFDDTATGGIAVSGHAINDAYDTILGDLMAENTDLSAKVSSADGAADAIKGTNYNLNIAYNLTMTATQVD